MPGILFMPDYKILLVGGSGSGKTTAIATVSETEVVNTDVFNTDDRLNKEMTTVGLDYGEVTIPGIQGARLRLYGTPGQARFSFIWQTLALGSAGIILLADNSQPEPLESLKFYLQYFKRLLADTDKAVVLGVVKTDISPSPDRLAWQQMLRESGFDIPVIIIDAREYDSVCQMLITLSKQLRLSNHE